jgi:hypothetical protein
VGGFAASEQQVGGGCNGRPHQRRPHKRPLNCAGSYQRQGCGIYPDESRDEKEKGAFGTAVTHGKGHHHNGTKKKGGGAGG